jgi:hypothetical protein
MQRHFSNRGEALAEAAAGKMMAGRRPTAKFMVAAQSGRRVISGQWRPQAPELIRRTRPTKKSKSKARNESILGPPQL